MSRDLPSAFLISIAGNVALVAWGGGSFPHQLVVTLIVFVAMILLGLGLSLLLVGGLGSGRRRGGTALLRVGMIAASCLLSAPIGAALNRSDIDRAKRYCEMLGPELENYRGVTGRYPDRLSEISMPGPLPRVLSGVEFYRPSEGCYRLTFLDPARMSRGFDFNSRAGIWFEWD